MTFVSLLQRAEVGPSGSGTVERQHSVTFFVHHGCIRSEIIYGFLILTFMTVLIVLLFIPSAVLIFKLLLMCRIKFRGHEEKYF
jgi:hypothetical protein